MSKFNLLSDLEEDELSPKKKFQLFEIEMGFERASVLIPLETADDFLTEALKEKPKSTASLKKIVERFEGEIQ